MHRAFLSPFTSTLVAHMDGQELRIIRGYVQALPAVPGSNGKEDAARVAVVTDDGTEYLVAHKGAGTGLVADINANVEVTGFVAVPASDPESAEEDAEELYLLTVKSYRLTDGFDDPWYDDTVR